MFREREFPKVLVFSRCHRTYGAIASALPGYAVLDAYAALGDKRSQAALKEGVLERLVRSYDPVDVVITTHEAPMTLLRGLGYISHTIGLSSLPLPGVAYQFSPDDLLKHGYAPLRKAIESHLALEKRSVADKDSLFSP